MSWLKDIIEENRRIVESWPAWKRGAAMTRKEDLEQRKEIAELRALIGTIRGLLGIQPLRNTDDIGAEEHSREIIQQVNRMIEQLNKTIVRLQGEVFVATEAYRRSVRAEQQQAQEITRLREALDDIVKIRFLLGNDPKLNPAYEMGDIAQHALKETI